MDHDHGHHTTTTPGMDHDHDMDMGHDSHMSMTMFFNFMMPFTVVFEGWEVTDNQTLAFSCCGVFVMAIIYELLKNLRQLLKAKFERQAIQTSMGDCCSEEGDSFMYRSQLLNSGRDCKYWIHVLTQSLLHVVQMFLAYILMLVAMAYNVWLFVAVLAGGGVGYILSALLFAQPIKPALSQHGLKGRDNHGTFANTSDTSNSDSGSSKAKRTDL